MPDCIHAFSNSACYLGQPAVTCVLVLDGPFVHVIDPSRLFVSQSCGGQEHLQCGLHLCERQALVSFVALSLARRALLREVQTAASLLGIIL